MKYLSVCSGIEAASVAFKPLGWEPLAFSEIEPFPRAVLQHHHPDVPLHGDFTELKAQPWIVDADLLCGGTPCQSFSVAGLRQSLSDGRGNLSLEFILLANAIDDLRSTAGRQPAWILWENVPGVLSTKDNAFGAFLGGLCGRDAAIPEPEGGWTCAGVVDGPTRVAAWRTLDAQFFGVAQRRKRVFVLALGGSGKWACADALLPITEGLRGDIAPRREAGQSVAPTIAGCANGGGANGPGRDVDSVESLIPERARALTTSNQRIDAETETLLVTHALTGEGFDASEDGTGRGVPLVMATGQGNAEVVSDGSPSLTCNHEPPIVFDPQQITSVTNRSNPQPGAACHTLHRGTAPMLVRMREGKEGGGKGPLVSKDQSLTLATANDQVLAYRMDNYTHEKLVESPVSATLLTGQEGARPAAAVVQQMQVRRLTPTECARLQGFPDQYLDITYRGKPASDGPRYKALGNSWAVPVVNWIGRRIEQVDEILTNQQPQR